MIKINIKINSRIIFKIIKLKNVYCIMSYESPLTSSPSVRSFCPRSSWESSPKPSWSPAWPQGCNRIPSWSSPCQPSPCQAGARSRRSLARWTFPWHRSQSGRSGWFWKLKTYNQWQWKTDLSTWRVSLSWLLRIAEVMSGWDIWNTWIFLWILIIMNGGTQIYLFVFNNKRKQPCKL